MSMCIQLRDHVLHESIAHRIHQLTEYNAQCIMTKEMSLLLYHHLILAKLALSCAELPAAEQMLGHLVSMASMDPDGTLQDSGKRQDAFKMKEQGEESGKRIIPRARDLAQRDWETIRLHIGAPVRERKPPLS